MPVEIGELVVRISVTDAHAAPQADLEAALRRLRQEIMERCREEIAARLQKDSER
jgi:hypothetical protein